MYNLADVGPFVEALDKTRQQYYPDGIDMLKDHVSIPGISMMYVLNKALRERGCLFMPQDNHAITSVKLGVQENVLSAKKSRELAQSVLKIRLMIS